MKKSLLFGCDITNDIFRKRIVYFNIKILNQEIKNLSGVFLGTKVISAQHMGKKVPTGTSTTVSNSFLFKDA